jgi:hypothetical protein
MIMIGTIFEDDVLIQLPQTGVRDLRALSSLALGSLV